MCSNGYKALVAEEVVDTRHTPLSMPGYLQQKQNHAPFGNFDASYGVGWCPTGNLLLNIPQFTAKEAAYRSITLAKPPITPAGFN